MGLTGKSKMPQLYLVSKRAVYKYQQPKSEDGDLDLEFFKEYIDKKYHLNNDKFKITDHVENFVRKNKKEN